MCSSRAALLAGIAGPVAFIGAWVSAGLVTEGYSPVSDTISRLAAQGAPTRPLMTAAPVAFGLLMRAVRPRTRSPTERAGGTGRRHRVRPRGAGRRLFPLTAGEQTTGDALHHVVAGG